MAGQGAVVNGAVLEVVEDKVRIEVIDAGIDKDTIEQRRLETVVEIAIGVKEILIERRVEILAPGLSVVRTVVGSHEPDRVEVKSRCRPELWILIPVQRGDDIGSVGELRLPVDESGVGRGHQRRIQALHEGLS